MEIGPLISEHLIQALGWTIIHSIWQGAIIALILFLILPMIRHKEAHIRYHFAYGSLLFAFATALSTLLYYLQSSNDTNNSIVFSEESLNAPVQSAGFGSALQFSNYIEANLNIITGIWITGMIIYSIKLGLAFYNIHLFKKHSFTLTDNSLNRIFSLLKRKFGIRQQVTLRFSNKISGPFVTGWIKPIIYFPFHLYCQLTPDQLEDILAHEFSHIVRNDFIMNLIQVFIENLFYYHPAIWWIGATIRKERELACDEMALDVSMSPRVRYAGSLLTLGEFSTQKIPQLSLPATGNSNDLLNRVSSILGQRQIYNQMKEKLIISVLIIGLMGIILGFRGPISINPKSEMLQSFELTLTLDSIADKTVSVNVSEPLKTKEIKIRSAIDKDHAKSFNGQKKIEKTFTVKTEKAPLNSEKFFGSDSDESISGEFQFDTISHPLFNDIKASGLFPGKLNIISNSEDQVYIYRIDTIHHSIHDIEINEFRHKVNELRQTERELNIEIQKKDKENLEHQLFIVQQELKEIDPQYITIELNAVQEFPVSDKPGESFEDNFIWKFRSENDLNPSEIENYRFRIHNDSELIIQPSSMEHIFRNKAKFENKLFQEMELNKLLSESKNKIILDENYMIINGQEVDPDMHEKYLELYEKRLGFSKDDHSLLELKKNYKQSNKLKNSKK
jgi:beta-lactamase regulating signal transducer with metallopeptidase domain